MLGDWLGEPSRLRREGIVVLVRTEFRTSILSHATGLVSADTATLVDPFSPLSFVNCPKSETENVKSQYPQMDACKTHDSSALTIQVSRQVSRQNDLLQLLRLPLRTTTVVGSHTPAVGIWSGQGRPLVAARSALHFRCKCKS